MKTDILKNFKVINAKINSDFYTKNNSKGMQ